MKKTNRIKTKILAAALSATMVFSFGAMTATTASAATNWNIGLSDDTQKEITDGFFSGASTMIGLLTKSHPVAGVIASGLFGAFKSFYGDATKTPQPSNQDIVNLLGELSDKIDDHFNAQSSQVKALQNIQNLQNFSKILTSVKGYNENAMGQIAIFDEDNVCAQDYQNIIDCTVGNDEFVKDFMDLSNLIIDGQKGTKGLPTFDQYLELSKVCKENNNDAALIKKDSANFNQMTLDQYSLFFTNLITGLLAKYELAEYNYNNGTIDLMTKNSLQASAVKYMENYFKKAGVVSKKYCEIDDTIKNLTVAKVTAGGKTTEMFSFGDAWVAAVKNNGIMQLVQDWKSDDLAGDVFYYEANTEFKNGALYVKGKNVTLDLCGHTIIHTNNQKYDICSDNATITLMDSSGKRSAINVLLSSGGKVTIDGVTIKDSADSGIRVNNLTLNVKDTTFTGNKNSAVVTEKNADTTIDNCIFRDNKESAVYNKDSKVTLKNSLFEDNCSDSDNGSKKNGGAVYIHYTLKVDNCNFVNNSANKGGAIFADYDATVTNSIFTGNSAAANGGAIFCDSMNYLTMSDVEIRNNTAGSNGGGLYCQKGSSSSCDPDISGKITIIDNQLTNGTKSNAFLGENKTSKCVFKITDNIDPSSRIGVTSNTNDGDLDICKIWNKDAYKNTANVFSYDTDKYKINRYTH